MRAAIIGLAVLGLVGCASTPTTQVTEAKGLAASWAALDAVAVTLDGLAMTHVLHGPNAALAASDLLKARDSLVAATAAYKARQNDTAAQNVAVATALITELVQIASTKGT